MCPPYWAFAKSKCNPIVSFGTRTAPRPGINIIIESDNLVLIRELLRRVLGLLRLVSLDFDGSSANSLCLLISRLLTDWMQDSLGSCLFEALERYSPRPVAVSEESWWWWTFPIDFFLRWWIGWPGNQIPTPKLNEKWAPFG